MERSKRKRRRREQRKAKTNRRRDRREAQSRFTASRDGKAGIIKLERHAEELKMYMRDGQKAVNIWNHTICTIMMIVFVHDV